MSAALVLTQVDISRSLVMLKAENARPSLVDQLVGIVPLSAICCCQDGTGGEGDHVQFLQLVDQLMR